MKAVKGTRISLDEKLAWIALNSIPAMGALRFNALLSRYRTAESVLKVNISELAGIRGVSDKIAGEIKSLSVERAREEYEECLDRGINVYCRVEDGYPELLRNIPQPPQLLYVYGNSEVLTKPMVGIVGCRRPTAYGLKMASILSSGLVRAGVVIISGLARGIDSEAHRAAIMASGRTVAVMASGFNHVYPGENKGLIEKMAKDGAVVSEFPLKMKPLKQNFPFRNRIISGMSRGVIVVQGQRGSGALITARYALEQGREVFAVPGDTGRKESEGPHALIRDGAVLVRDISDVLGELEYEAEKPVTAPPLENLSLFEEKVLRAIGGETVHPDEVIVKTDLPAGELMQVLLGLEMKGFVRRTSGQKYFLSGKL